MLISNFFWKFSERLLAQGASFIVSLILARILMPKDYGIVALVLIFIDIANVIVTSGFNTSLIQNKNADELDFSSVFWFCLLISLLIYIFIYFGVIPLSKFYNEDMIVPVFRVMGIRIIISALNTVQHAYVSRNLLFKKFFWSTLFGTAISAFIGIFLALKGFGVWALVFQYLTNTFVDSIVLLIKLDWKPKFLFSFKRLKELSSFGWKILLDSILSIIQQNLRGFVIAKTFSPTDLAYYTKSQTIPNMACTNISVSISSVLLPVMSNANDDKDKILAYLRKAIRLCSYIIFPMLTGIIIVSREFILLVLTEKWLPMKEYLQLYCLICMMMVIMPPKNEALKSIGESGVFLSEHSLARIIDVGILLLFIKSLPIILTTTLLITTIVFSAIIMYNSKRYNNYRIVDQICDIKNALTGCILMYSICYMFNFLSLPLLFGFVFKILIGVMAYILFSILLKFEEFEILVKIFESYKNIIFVKLKKDL